MLKLKLVQVKLGGGRVFCLKLPGLLLKAKVAKRSLLGETFFGAFWRSWRRSIKRQSLSLLLSLPKGSLPCASSYPSWTVIDASWAGLHQDRVSWSAWWWQPQLASGKFSYLNLACRSWSYNACYACKEKTQEPQNPSSATMLSSSKLPFIHKTQKLEPHVRRALKLTQGQAEGSLSKNRKNNQKSGVTPTNQTKEGPVHELLLGAFRNKSSM